MPMMASTVIRGFGITRNSFLVMPSATIAENRFSYRRRSLMTRSWPG